MTRKDYRILAACISGTRDVYSSNAQVDAALADVVATLCDVLAADNPRFDRETFTHACEATCARTPGGNAA